MVLEPKLLEEIRDFPSCWFLEDLIWTPCSENEPKKTMIHWDWGYDEWIKPDVPVSSFEEEPLTRLLQAIHQESVDYSVAQQAKVKQLAESLPTLRIVQELLAYVQQCRRYDPPTAKQKKRVEDLTNRIGELQTAVAIEPPKIELKHDLSFFREVFETGDGLYRGGRFFSLVTESDCRPEKCTTDIITTGKNRFRYRLQSLGTYEKVLDWYRKALGIVEEDLRANNVMAKKKSLSSNLIDEAETELRALEEGLLQGYEHAEGFGYERRVRDGQNVYLAYSTLKKGRKINPDDARNGAFTSNSTITKSGILKKDVRGRIEVMLEHPYTRGYLFVDGDFGTHHVRDPYETWSGHVFCVWSGGVRLLPPPLDDLPSTLHMILNAQVQGLTVV